MHPPVRSRALVLLDEPTAHVDAATGLYSNDQGEAILSAVWVDPDFNAAQSAFYYVRVLELPTPRHSTLDAIALNVDPLQTEAMTGQPVSIQERAYTSPIWYTPEYMSTHEYLHTSAFSYTP